MTKSRSPKVFLIHAAAVSMPPINACFASRWPEARVANLLEDALYDDLKEAGGLTEAITDRVCRLGQYCESAGADAIMFTGSAFGPAIDQLRSLSSVPVLKPNEALYEALCAQLGRIALLSTVPVALSSMMSEIGELAKLRGRQPAITPIAIDEAFEALMSGDATTHDRLVTAAIQAQEKAHDVVALGQFSMWTVGEHARRRGSKPLMTTPDTAVDHIRHLLGA